MKTDSARHRRGNGAQVFDHELNGKAEPVKAVLERGLPAELGYEKGDPAGRGSANSRNGTSPKTLASEVGDVPLAVPLDRVGVVRTAAGPPSRSDWLEKAALQRASRYRDLDLDVVWPAAGSFIRVSRAGRAARCR